ncbi:hypothetical protein ACHAC9_03480 [Massilia sp. CMS3.1]|uniref:hypothetical protein n=1 Tax=Massilia sp. CMS3.1 TaxID=3373083 RepID=UPI003EE7F018
MAFKNIDRRLHALLAEQGIALEDLETRDVQRERGEPAAAGGLQLRTRQGVERRGA